MYIKQLYTKCLAEAAYYIESNGEAAIIDPLRDIQVYLQLAKERGARIKYVFETHFHADFVSGHLDLHNSTGAEIIYGPQAQADYAITVAKDNQLFPLGEISIKVLHTPGHTLESACFLVLDKNGKEHSIFTGDTLFVGDVGRPDLAVSSSLKKEDLASMLFDSINEKLSPLASDTVMYPGHGPGSQCGKSMGSELQSTLGAQLTGEHSILTMEKDAFVSMVTEGLSVPPQYFPKNALINKQGYSDTVNSIIDKSLNALDAVTFDAERKKKNTLVLDTRPAPQFSKGFIPDAINIGLEGFFAVWAGTLIDQLDTRILLVTEKGKEKDTIIRLARVGYDNVIGHLEGGLNAWEEGILPIHRIQNCCPTKFRILTDSLNIIDTRTKAEFEQGHVSNAINIPLAELETNIPRLDKNLNYYVYCKSGYRSVIAASILKKNGVNNVINVKKGYDAITSKNGCCSMVIE